MTSQEFACREHEIPRRVMKDYYGWRARIGLIYMASSTVMEPEFYAMAPEGVSIHTDRIILPAPTIAGLEQMMEGAEIRRCASFLAEAPLHVIMFGGTSATFLHGIGWDRKVIEQMAAVTHGIPTSTSSSAVLNALKVLAATKVSIVTPYLDVITARARVFLEQHGFSVLSTTGLNIDTDHEIGAVPPSRRRSVVLELHELADGRRHCCPRGRSRHTRG